MSVEWFLLQSGPAQLHTAWLCADLGERLAPPSAGGNWRSRLQASLERLAQLLHQPVVRIALQLCAPRLAGPALDFDPDDLSPANLQLAQLLQQQLLALKSDGGGHHVLDSSSPEPPTFDPSSGWRSHPLCAATEIESGARSSLRPLSRIRLRVRLSENTLRQLCNHFQQQLAREGAADPGLMTAQPPTLSGLLLVIQQYPALQPAHEHLQEVAELLEAQWSPEQFIQLGLEQEVRTRLQELLQLSGTRCLELSAHRGAAALALGERSLRPALDALAAVLPFLAPVTAAAAGPARRESADGTWQQFLLERILLAREQQQVEVLLSAAELRSFWRFVRAPARTTDHLMQANLSLWSWADAREAPTLQLHGVALPGVSPGPAAQLQGRSGQGLRLAGALRQSQVLDHMRELPRIRVGSLVVSPAHWLLDEEEIGELLGTSDGAERQHRLEQLRSRRGLPRWIGLSTPAADLELDLECPLSALCLFAALARDSFALLTEVPRPVTEISELGHALRHRFSVPLRISQPESAGNHWGGFSPVTGEQRAVPAD